ncbi:VWA domain-containing protein [Polymorphobacter multimanifer]|uniref:vWA domain-containing protein n=1 Tax=Polymorphobacter multimanifer TaxID=1070431 RepID=UPI00166F5D49|nr:VWA domain-containing protein [Polymorphobacter multimanifer]GGI75628.1 VWA domain-containing protein [Polymorphobacter multimanifer]
MFLTFLEELRAAKIPASMKEHLMLLEALKADVIDWSITDFYYLARAVYVKDEALLDRFDLVFGRVFKGLETSTETGTAEIPAEWLRAIAELNLSAEEMAELEKLGWDKLMETLAERLKEQKERHEGGNKWIGTGGKSPFGANGSHPEGVRIGQDKNRKNSAVKVWDKREFRNLDDNVELGTRNIKVALRRLRRFAREGAADELDLDKTISGTAKQGWLDIVMRPERHNAVKLLLMLDVGGSMDPHIKVCEELFSAARSEFKHLEFFYFHNCPYEALWKDNKRRWSERTPVMELLHKFPHDYKLVFVGDASMSPYEINYAGGSVEHWNEEPGEAWLGRMLDIYRSAAWLNPIPEKNWSHSQSIQMIRQIMEDRMYPLSLEGLDRAMRELTRSH